MQYYVFVESLRGYESRYFSDSRAAHEYAYDLGATVLKTRDSCRVVRITLRNGAPISWDYYPFERGESC